MIEGRSELDGPSGLIFQLLCLMILWEDNDPTALLPRSGGLEQTPPPPRQPRGDRVRLTHVSGHFCSALSAVRRQGTRGSPWVSVPLG